MLVYLHKLYSSQKVRRTPDITAFRTPINVETLSTFTKNQIQNLL